MTNSSETELKHEETDLPTLNTFFSSESRFLVFESKTRFRILLFLMVSGELSLTELAEKMNKSKPALHHHLQKMIEADVVVVSREEPYRGSIMQKFYTLAPGFQPPYLSGISAEEIFEQAKEGPEKRQELVKRIVEIQKSVTSYLKSSLELIDVYNEFLLEEAQAKEDLSLEDFQELVTSQKIGYRIDFMSEKHLTFYRDEIERVRAELRERMIKEKELAQGTDSVLGWEYVINTMILPIKYLLELEKERGKI